MLTDRQLERLAQPILDIFNDIEIELVREVASRFDTYETIGGSLEWQLKRLEEMGILNEDCIKVIAKYSKKTKEEITNMLKKAGMANFNQAEMDKAYDNGLLRVNYQKALESAELNRIIRLTNVDISNTVKLIQTKCIESARQDYMDIVNTAYIETSSGVRSYTESIARSLKKFAQKGITGATYKRIDKDGNEKIVNYSLEGVIRRDIVTGVNSLSNKASIDYAKQCGYEYVEVSQHLGARVTKHNDYTNHAWWQGKVYKIDGSDEYPNLVEVTGYGDIQGLGGVNCRHRTFPFIPGVSTPQEPLDYDEVKKRYEAEQKLRKLERRMRMLRREYAMYKASNNKEESAKTKKDILTFDKEIDAYCAKNGLKREYARETVKENY